MSRSRRHRWWGSSSKRRILGWTRCWWANRGHLQSLWKDENYRWRVVWWSVSRWDFKVNFVIFYGHELELKFFRFTLCCLFERRAGQRTLWLYLFSKWKGSRRVLYAERYSASRSWTRYRKAQMQSSGGSFRCENWLKKRSGNHRVHPRVGLWSTWLSATNPSRIDDYILDKGCPCKWQLRPNLPPIKYSPATSRQFGCWF